MIYFLHGAGGNESADAPAISRILRTEVEAGRIPPVIGIFPNGGMSGYRDSAAAQGRVESMIVRELVPLVDRTYPTQANRAGRVVGGFSMGGGGSIRLALGHPDDFSAAASWAGALAQPQLSLGEKPQIVGRRRHHRGGIGLSPHELEVLLT